MPRMMRRMARTAVVVGTATATAGAVNRRQASKNAQAQAQAEAAYAEASPLPQEEYAPPAPAPEEDDTITQLERLGALKAQGILTEEEFLVQKQKLLGIQVRSSASAGRACSTSARPANGSGDDRSWNHSRVRRLPGVGAGGTPAGLATGACAGTRSNRN